MNFTWFSGAVTVLSMLVFIGILYWAYSKNNKERFKDIGMFFFENDTDVTGK